MAPSHDGKKLWMTSPGVTLSSLPAGLSTQHKRPPPISISQAKSTVDPPAAIQPALAVQQAILRIITNSHLLRREFMKSMSGAGKPAVLSFGMSALICASADPDD